MKESPILDQDSLARIFEFNPKCIVVIHMNGRSSHIEGISAECKKRGIYLIEDAAQAIGSKVNNRFLGTFGDIGCFSLALTKTISSGQGGFCVTNDEGIFKRLRDLRSHGMSDVFFPEWESFGMNFRFTDLQAALAITQLEDLAPRLDRQINIRNQYLVGTESLKNVQLLPMKSDSGENGPYFDCKVPDAKTFTNKMAEYGVQVRPFYPSLSTASYLNIQNRDATPNAAYWHKHGVSLPSGPNLTNSQVSKVIEVLSKVDSSLQK
jgi:perosamine synthetase